MKSVLALDRVQVGRGEDRHQRQRGDPDRDAGQPALDDRGAGHRLDREHDDPEVPVQPAGREARQLANAARAYSTTPVVGRATAISPSIRIVSITMIPARP
jgi:hypothetical protein